MADIEQAVTNLRRDLNLNPNSIYFGYPAVGLIPRSNIERQHQFMEAQHQAGFGGIMPLLSDFRENLRPLIARWTGAHLDEVALSVNTTLPLNIVAQSIHWNEGDEIIAFENEYPANVYPWLGLEKSHGVKVRFLPETALYNVDEILSACHERVRLVAVSLIQFGTGLAVDYSALGQGLAQLSQRRGRPIYYVGDASQYLGAHDIDFNRSHFHVLAASAHKWMLSSFGASFFLIKRELLQPGGWPCPLLGAGSVVDEFNYLDYNLTLKPDGGRYEAGTQHFQGLYGLSASLKGIAAASSADKEMRLADLSARLEGRLAETGALLFPKNAPTPGHCSRSLLSIYWPGGQVDVANLCEGLAQRGIIAYERSGRLRVGIHFFHTHQEVDALMDGLAHLLKK